MDRAGQLIAAFLSLFVSLTVFGQVWVQHGPRPNTQGQVEGITGGEVVGAVHSVAAHPTDANILFIGAVNGGIWRTGNATAANPTWVPQLGLNVPLSIGAIEFDPTDGTNMTLMAGSGRFSNYSLRPGSDRVGIFRTTNGGTNWTNITGGGTISGLNVCGVAPRGATLVLAADGQGLQPGIWRSIDTGGIWTRISGLAGSGLPAGASFDLASDPSNNARLFTNAGTAGIFRSNDTGATWTKVSNAAMDAVLAAGVRNVEIAVGTSNNVYVAMVNTADQLSGLFRSPDGGGMWTALDLPPNLHPGGQGDTNTSIAADRTNANVVYLGGDRQPSPFPNAVGANDFSGRLFRVDASLAAGTQAAHITHSNTSGGSSPHADSRDMAIDANNNLIETNDGGVYRRTTPLLNTGDWFSLNGDLAVAELHDAAWDSRSKIIIGGAQDTGTPHEITSGDPKWLSVSTADGGDVAVDDTGTPDMSIRYSSNQNLGSFRRRTYGTANNFVSQVFPARTLVGGGAALGVQFTTPVVLNNVTPTRLIIGGNNSTYESMNQGDTITEIGPGIPVNARGREPIAYGATGNADMLYVGSNDDVFVRAAAPPAVLTATDPNGASTQLIAGIAINPADPMNAFAVDTTNVYRTANAGGMWTDITGNLQTLTPGTLLSIAFSTSNPAGSVIVGGFNGIFIAPGPAFNVWTALGTGLPRVPVYDLEYDAIDEVLVAGLMGRGAWTINLEQRDPVDVALVLDLSGSMLSPACSTCDTRLQVLKDAVEIFVQLWTVFAIPDDRLGLSYFRTSINEFLVGGNALFPVAANAAAVIADVQSQTTVLANLTAMGGGIQTAVNRLTDAARPRNVVLFTDGMQNVNPMVNSTTFVIDNEPGRPASGVSPTMPPTDLNAALGRKVNAIGVGATASFVDLLDDIASETNGVSKITTAPDDDLRRFYVEELIDALRTFSPQLVAYRYGAVGPAGAGSIEDFTTNASARKVVFKVSWKRGAQLDFNVEKDGAPIARKGRVIIGPFYKIFEIDVPTVDALGRTITPGGSWRLRITGTSGATYEAAAIVDEEALVYDFEITGKDHVAGTPLPLRARLEFAGQPVVNATVTARVLVPKQGLGTLLATFPTPANLRAFAYEPQATDAQRKYQLLLGNDAFQAQLKPDPHSVTLTHSGGGVYTASFNGTALTGPYTAIFHVSGSRTDIGTYERSETRSVSVRFGEAVLSASGLALTGGERVTGGRRYGLRVRPVDANGNFLGPDYGHRIAVFVNGVRVAAPPRDMLDGSYIFDILVPEPVGASTVTVTVMDKPLFNGPVTAIPTTGGGGGGGKLALSAHLGATFPLSGFPSHADNGYLAELDLEYRITPAFSIEGVLGHYDFGSAGAINGFTLFAKKYLPGSGAWRWYGALGPGLFKPEGGGGTELGASLAAGLNYAITTRTEFDAGAVYTHVFSDDVGWLGLRVGVKVSF